MTKPSKLKVIAGSDLETDSAYGPDWWQSTGDDPHFKVQYPFVRLPIIVAFLRSDHDAIDLKAYIQRGFGLRERDAVTFQAGKRFIIVADVGRSGVNRSFRIDPATFPCKFSFSIEAFANRHDAEDAINRRQSQDMANAVQCDLGRLPRFSPPIKLPKLGKSNGRLAAFAKAQYQLAEKVPATPQAESMWLSTVVPVYNAPRRYLDDLLRSFELQNDFNAELILSDDASSSEETLRWYKDLGERDRVRVVRNPVNTGIAIATNSGLALASGTWVTFLDHDDLIAPHAFKMIANTLAEQPDARFVYTDELIVDDNLVPIDVMLKPVYDPVLLTGMNYINHFSLYRRDRLQAIGNLRTGFDGSQDYDLLLRYLDGLPESQILHLPYLAYWWRRIDSSYSHRFLENATMAARTAIKDSFARQKRSVEVEPSLSRSHHYVNFDVAGESSWPKISIIIPNRDKIELITTILSNLFDRTDYPDFEVIVVDNGSTDPQVLKIYANYERTQTNFRALIKNEKFNFARAINRGMESASGEHFLMLNNDVEVIESNWLKEMVSCLNFEGTGIVGAKLLYGNGMIQHAGVIAGFGGLAGHWYYKKPRDFGGPMNRLHLRNSMTCVTGAVMLISGDCARATGAWDEENFAVAYNDIDYCLRARNAGFRVIWTPYACLYHHESQSRGSDKLGERKKRFDLERDNLRRIHKTSTFEDPSINPGFEKGNSAPGLQVLGSLMKSRPGFLAARSQQKHVIQMLDNPSSESAKTQKK